MSYFRFLNNMDSVLNNEVKIEDLAVKKADKAEIVSSDFIFDFPDPKESAEEVLITKECLQRIADAVCVIHKNFLDIFYLRYVKGLKQNEISKSLNISQSEISKRLMQLSKLISNFLDGSKR